MATKPLATFRTDGKTWEDFQAKAKSKGTNASALLQKFVRDYLDDKLDSRIDSPAAPDVDIQSMIDDALRSKILELREEFIEHEAIAKSESQKCFEAQIATFRSEYDAMIEAKIAAALEATESANFTPALLQRVKEVAPLELKEAA